MIKNDIADLNVQVDNHKAGRQGRHDFISAFGLSE